MSERVHRYQEAVAAQDFATLGELRHPDYQCYYPQSGERFSSHEDWARAHHDYAARVGAEDLTAATVKGGDRKAEVTRTAGPLFMLAAPVISISDTGDLVTMEGKATWPDGKDYHWVRIIEYRDHLVWHETEYFAEPFDPPAWRAPFVQIDRGGEES